MRRRRLSSLVQRERGFLVTAPPPPSTCVCACVCVWVQVPPAKPLVIIISGPSGVGKDAVIQKLKEVRDDLYFVVTATSRCGPAPTG